MRGINVISHYAPHTHMKIYRPDLGWGPSTGGVCSKVMGSQEIWDYIWHIIMRASTNDVIAWLVDKEMSALELCMAASEPLHP